MLFTRMSNTWYLITVQNLNKITTFISEIVQQTLKPTVTDHGTPYEANPSSHYGGMCEDGYPDAQMHWVTDRTLSYIPQFRLRGGGNNNMLFFIHDLKVWLTYPGMIVTCNSNHFIWWNFAFVKIFKKYTQSFNMQSKVINLDIHTSTCTYLHRMHRADT